MKLRPLPSPPRRVGSYYTIRAEIPDTSYCTFAYHYYYYCYYYGGSYCSEVTGYYAGDADDFTPSPVAAGTPAPTEEEDDYGGGYGYGYRRLKEADKAGPSNDTQAGASEYADDDGYQGRQLGILSQWKMLTFTIDSSYNYVVYEDGVQIGSSTESYYPSSRSRAYSYLGRRAATSYGGEYFSGYIKSFQHWDRALSASEVAALYQYISSPTSAPTVTPAPSVLTLPPTPAPTDVLTWDLVLYDTVGDGWNGAEYTIADAWDGTLYGSGTLEYCVDANTGEVCSYDATVPVAAMRPGRCYELTVTADADSAEVSWTFGTLSGGDDTVVSFEIDYAAEGPVSPCSLLAPSAPPTATPAPTAVKPIKIELLSSDAEVGFNGAAAVVRDKATKAEVWRGASTFGASYDMMIDGLEELTLYTIGLEPPSDMDTRDDWAVTPVGFAFQGQNLTLLQSVDFVVAGGAVDIRNADSLTSQLIHSLCFESCDYKDAVAAFGNALDVQTFAGDVTCDPTTGEGLVFGASRRLRAPRLATVVTQ